MSSIYLLAVGGIPFVALGVSGVICLFEREFAKGARRICVAAVMALFLFVTIFMGHV